MIAIHKAKQCRYATLSTGQIMSHGLRTLRTVTLASHVKRLPIFCMLRRFIHSLHRSNNNYRYYQVVMMIDIFQYSNMYTLRKSVQWLADEPHVREECGPYVTKPGPWWLHIPPLNRR